ncbi:MAG: glucose 1-dehydrogenase [Peptococcaceae bacterium]|jgi:NAD(P)-dependent dehydrogenase (short-subunit alcohol dehydrogenase family)|nr:glucose 1-dehydrogenase [Peptococcaceae bacterium]MDH7525387.1 glucose 1-dehydrogenase [Peptococcaceae bacterium]
MNYQLDFRNKTVLVTGAGRGIGKSISIGFGSLGAHVILVSRTRDQLETAAQEVVEAGGKADVITADLSSIDNIKAIVTEVKHRFKKLDVLINNAGITKRMPSEDVGEEDWDRILNTNLKALFFMCSRVAKEIMIPQGFGKIVNMASAGGIQGITYSAPYCATKGGIVLLTKVLGCEWAKYNIQVNAVGPAYISTELVEGFMTEEFRKRVINRTPAGRLGTPEEVVGGFLFLASNLANYITGHTLLIDGGLTSFFI